ncbi:hypothetical protein DFP94_109110 [Fontibacillus phaseoli]|uniref:Uncharacterized protein n=1 Tax=Fontibacillus phaseoli TaxID=1416533 RepID=A0A369B9Z8_9BACL|nr:hypothetical protein [Fontibacillus phaseoli]RCX17386.1 hypothetical protein DFP94_109110 [Fontibacillus phaseoli]
MQPWLKKRIENFPAVLKSQVDSYLDEGTFISFAGPEKAGQDSSERDGKGLEENVGESAKSLLMHDLLGGPDWTGTGILDPGNKEYLWVTLPEGMDAEVLLKASLLKGTAFWPGSIPFPEEGKDDQAVGRSPDSGMIRLYYAGQSEDRILAGLARISEAISEFTARFEN